MSHSGRQENLFPKCVRFCSVYTFQSAGPRNYHLSQHTISHKPLQSQPAFLPTAVRLVMTCHSQCNELLEAGCIGRFIMYSGFTKIYYRKTVGHVFTKPVQTEGTTEIFFRLKLFFIVVHISAANRCEYM